MVNDVPLSPLNTRMCGEPIKLTGNGVTSNKRVTRELAAMIVTSSDGFEGNSGSYPLMVRRDKGRLLPSCATLGGFPETSN